MFPDQIVVGNILIECPDQIIPVFVSVFDSIIELMAVSIGLPHQVHPVPCPFFSEAGGSEEFVHQCGSGNLQGFSNFSGGGWKSDEVKINPADPGSVIGGLSRL